MNILREHLKTRGIDTVAVLRPDESSKAIAVLELRWRNGMVMRNIMVFPFPQKEDSFHLWYPSRDSQEYSPNFMLNESLEQALIMLALIASKQDAYDEEGVGISRPRYHNRRELLEVYKGLRDGEK